MAITTYSELKTAITNWMARADLSGSAEEFIFLAERKLNRELRGIDADASLVTVAGSADVDCTSAPFKRAIALFMMDAGHEAELVQRSLGTMPLSSANEKPTEWAVDGNNISLSAPSDGVYALRLVYAPRFALSDAAPTNWLLDNHPDVYLAASMLWGHGYVQNFQQSAIWQSVLDEGLISIRSENATRRKSMLRMPPELRTGGVYYDGDVA